MTLKHLLFITCILLLAACQQQTASPTPTAESATPTTESTPAYRDPTLPTEQRVEDLLGRMSLAEKIGQMTLVEKNSIVEPDITSQFIGALLSGGGGYPNPNTPADWAQMVDGFQEYALQTPLAVPLIYGVDAVHGHNNVVGTVIFPHNIGLGATRNPTLVQEIGRITAIETAATGIYWDYAPVIAVPQDIRWGRTYEGYSENTELVTQLGEAFLRGLQGDDLSSGVLGTPKHFIGDGGTSWGSSTTENYQIDQGITEVDEATLRALYLPPYQKAIEAGAMSVMISFSSWGGMKMHAQQYLITDVLKGELGFQGFVVSDWGGIDQIDSNYYTAVVTAVNAGVDMNMVPIEYGRFITTLTQAVEAGDVPMARIDDAVRRILHVKFELGLFERPFSDPALLSQVGIAEHRAVAQQAVRESLVLLQNNAALPIAKDTPLIYVGGEAADDIGIQSGGWTVEWQGKVGNITPGTTILEAIQNTVSADTQVEFSRFGRFDAMADVGIVVVGERPYAEGRGDNTSLALSEADINTIERMRQSSHLLIVVLISGRPLIITPQLPLADAWVAAWLPGSEGQGVADVLFGDFPFTGKLPYTWPRTANQLPFNFANLPSTGCDAPLFPFGYGLSTDDPPAAPLPVCP